MGQTIRIPMNRVEGDLEISVEVSAGRVEDAWSAGTMFRGFERLLVGRGALDGLVITPRICGLCSASHLTAAARALDRVARVAPPANAVRLRNVALMAEHIQSDVRQAFLMFAADFVNQAYSGQPLFDEAVRRYAPFAGETVVEVVRETKHVLEIIALIGGQWPHSSFMVPGGIASMPDSGALLQCRLTIERYRRWYERRILGCAVERWQDVKSGADLDAWLSESGAHRESDLGFFIRFSRAIGIDRTGRGHGNFLSFGSLDLPNATKVRVPDGGAQLVRAGFSGAKSVEPFDHAKVVEHVAYSHFVDYEGGRHPFDGETVPETTGETARKYSWAKAPRYDGLPAETGPLAEAVIARDSLVTDLLANGGPSAFVRELARIVRAATLLGAMEQWLAEATSDGGGCYSSPGRIVAGEGAGLTQAGRGALGHWVRIEDATIRHYQVITPTAWNASPRDTAGTRGPLEEALVGTQVRDVENPVEVGHVVRSFDPCLVCTVHALQRGKRVGRARVGGTP